MRSIMGSIAVAIFVVVAAWNGVAVGFSFKPPVADQDLLKFAECDADQMRKTETIGFDGPCLAATMDVEDVMKKVGFDEDEEVDDGSDHDETLNVTVTMELDNGQTIEKNFAILTYWRRQGESVFGPSIANSPCQILPKRSPDDAAEFHCLTTPEVTSSSREELESTILVFRPKSKTVTTMTMTTTAKLRSFSGSKEKSETVVVEDVQDRSMRTMEEDDDGGEVIQYDLSYDNGKIVIIDPVVSMTQSDINGTNANNGPVGAPSERAATFVGWQIHRGAAGSVDRTMVVALVTTIAVVVAGVIVAIIVSRKQKLKKTKPAEGGEAAAPVEAGGAADAAEAGGAGEAADAAEAGGVGEAGESGEAAEAV